jgi:hypothetical protein
MSHVEDSGRPAGLDSQQSTPLTPKSLVGSEQEHHSDIESCATSVPETVMAEQVANDVVKEAQSVGRSAPIDDSASTTNTPAVNGEPPSGTPNTKAIPREASSTKPTVNGTDAPAHASAHVSDKAEGNAAAVSRDQEVSGRGLTVAGRDQAVRCTTARVQTAPPQWPLERTSGGRVASCGRRERWLRYRH